MSINPFDITGTSQAIMPDADRQDERLVYWVNELIREARARKAREAATRSLDSREI